MKLTTLLCSGREILLYYVTFLVFNASFYNPVKDWASLSRDVRPSNGAHYDPYINAWISMV